MDICTAIAPIEDNHLNESRAVEDAVAPAAGLHEGLINFIFYRGMPE